MAKKVSKIKVKTAKTIKKVKAEVKPVVKPAVKSIVKTATKKGVKKVEEQANPDVHVDNTYKAEEFLALARKDSDVLGAFIGALSSVELYQIGSICMGQLNIRLQEFEKPATPAQEV